MSQLLLFYVVNSRLATLSFFVHDASRLVCTVPLTSVNGGYTYFIWKVWQNE